MLGWGAALEMSPRISFVEPTAQGTFSGLYRRFSAVLLAERRAVACRICRLFLVVGQVSLFAPLVYLPPLPPVEIFFADIERALGAWPAVLFPTLALALIIWDGVAFRRKQGLHGWTRQMLRGTALSIAAHVAL